MKLREFLADATPAGFQSEAYYSPEGDSLTCFFADREHYAQRVDGLLTVYLDMETDDLVGCKIKGVKRLTTILGRFDILIEGEHGVSLGSYFLAGLTLSDEKCRAYYERCSDASRGVRLLQEEMEGVFA